MTMRLHIDPMAMEPVPGPGTDVAVLLRAMAPAGRASCGEPRARRGPQPSPRAR
jgi:hypothetical protein